MLNERLLACLRKPDQYKHKQLNVANELDYVLQYVYRHRIEYIWYFCMHSLFF